MDTPPTNALVLTKSRELSAVAAAETSKAMIQAAYTMAATRPRDKMQIREKMIEICKDPDFAEAAFYKPRPVGWDAKTRQQKTVQDFSIRFAEELHTQWTNLWVKTYVLYDDEQMRKLEVVAIDLENNSVASEEFVIPKVVERKSKKFREEDVLYERKNSSEETVYGLRATDQEVKQMAGAERSKLKRQLVLGLAPADLKNELRRLIYATREKEVTDDPIAYRKRWVDAFNRIGVSVKDLEGYLNKKIEDANSDDWGELSSIHQAIKEGGARWSDYASRPMPQESTINPDDIQSGNPEDHTDVRDSVKQTKNVRNKVVVTCKAWWENTLNALKEKYRVQDKGIDYAYQLMAEASLDLETMPNNGLPAFQKWVFGTMVPEMQAENWLPQGDITI